MRISVEGPGHGVDNMRLDEALLAQVEATGGALARIYGWDGPWVSLGRYQRPDRDLLASCPVPWVMRPTGGRGVLHGHDLTLSLAIAFDSWIDAPPKRSPRALAEALTRPIAHALSACGARAKQGADGLRQDRSADCFAHAAPTDLADAETGTKLCGAALRLTERGVLLQASIPIGPPLVDPGLVFASPAPSMHRAIDRGALESALLAALSDWAKTLRQTRTR